MTLFEDLCPDYVDLAAYRLDGVTSSPVGDGMPLRLDRAEAEEWLTAMEPHRYALEDAIGCTVGVDDEGHEIVCAAADLAVSKLKSMTHERTALAQKILVWIDRALATGADQVNVCIAVARKA
jgi:hypothetical protein